MAGKRVPGHYIVGAGDTIESIARSYNVSVGEMWKFNPNSSYTLHAGQILVAPVGGSPAQRAYAEKMALFTAIDLTKIPGVMWKNGWTKGAQLMTKWFSRRALPNALGNKWVTSLVNCDTTTIKLWWVLTYSQPNGIYRKIWREQMWQNMPARKELIKQLKMTGKVGKPGTVTFGDFRQSVPTIDMYQYVINSLPFSPGATMNSVGLNDLIAALASFNFKVAVTGSVTGSVVTIKQASIFVKDTYDFQKPVQALGTWDIADATVGRVMNRGGIPVTNEHFREWRKLHGRGGDFLVYTDMKIINLTAPVSFNINTLQDV